MPTPVKQLDSMDGHRTAEEKELRAEAEAEILPERELVNLATPKSLKGDARARRYWQNIVSRADGLKLLDDLDTEMLETYVSMLSRRDALNKLLRQGIAEARKPKLTFDDRLKAMDKVDSLNAKVMSMERNILQYADKLGLTPSGRMRLAKQRADNAVNADNDDDLYGD